MLTHMDSQAPQLLNVLRVCDAPDALGMLAPRPLVLLDCDDSAPVQKIQRIYEAAGAAERLQVSAGS
jgi:hypothetical protein